MRTPLLAAALAACPTLAQDCPWDLLPTPNPGGSLILFGLDADDQGNVWTAGARTVFVQPAGIDQFNYIARWNGSEWVETPAPQPSTLRLYQGLSDIIALPSGEAIAVGGYNPPAGSSQAQSMRWNGSSWSLMNSPSYAGGSGFDCVGRAGDTVWAGGHKWSELPPPAATTYPMAARRNGNSWEVVFVPPLAITGGRSYNYIRAIEGAGEDDAWAAGIAQETGFIFGPAAMMIRWDGQEWTQYDIFPLLDSTDFSGLSDLAVLTSDDVWAAGWDYDLSRQQTIPLILHWDGSAWSKSPVPVFDESAELRAIAARAPDDVYAAGTQTDLNGFPHALVLHFDGTAWTEVPQDAVVDYGTWFRAMDFDADTLWVAGQANNLSEGITQRREPCDTACSADFNADGTVNFFDISDFIDAFSTQDPATDLDANGQSNFFDVAAFIDAYNAGCP
jgi:hypothetical protein